MKTDLLLRQTRMRFPTLATDEVEIAAIEKGGSDRKFYRVRCSPEQTLILVKYNLDREENRHYVAIAQFLEQNGIRAPKIYFHDPDEGLIWIEDLGERDLFSYRDDGWLVRRAFYESALDEAAGLHALSSAAVDKIRESLPAEFNAALYQWEQGYFLENALGRVFKLDAAILDSLTNLPALHEIAEKLAARQRVLVHRDFQSQNIIIRNGAAYLIDFQGMRPGLAEYDLASLIYDPYVALSAPEREELIEYYQGRRAANGKPVDSDFAEILRLCAMQRLMQALGAYGFLGLVKGHKAFLAHIPVALDSLRHIVADIHGLDKLRSVLAALK